MRVAAALRRDHGFAGYIHLKTIPEASPWLIEQAGLLGRPAVDQPRAADRRRACSASRRRRTRRLDHARAMGQMRERIDEAQAEERRRFSPAGQITQMIVGADDDHRRRRAARPAPRSTADYELRRVYYSAFSPIPEPSAVAAARSRRRCCARTGSTRPTG